MPTNLGVDVKWRMRQYAANHANLNDFILIELELTNTGVLDADGDGVPEKTDNRVEALTLHMQNEPINSMTNRNNGRRGAVDGLPVPLLATTLRWTVAVLHGTYRLCLPVLLPAR